MHIILARTELGRVHCDSKLARTRTSRFLFVLDVILLRQLNTEILMQGDPG